MPARGVDRDVVFDLNGNWVRRPEMLLFSHYTTRTIDIVPTMLDYILRSITDFLIDLAVSR